MIKVVLFCCFFVVVSFAQSTAQRIQDNALTFESQGKLEKDLTRQLGEIAKKLLHEEQLLKTTDASINSVNSQIEKQQLIVQNSESELQILKKHSAELVQLREDAETNLIKIIAEEFSYFLIIDSGYEENYESLIVDEALKSISEINNVEFKKYADDYTRAGDKIAEFSAKIKTINSNIVELEKKKGTLAVLKKDKAKTIMEVEKEKKAYNDRLLSLKNEQKELQETLKSLNILLKEETKEKVSAAENIKNIGSSYQASKVKKYKGQKTSSPLEEYTVLQKFGDYVDPVYNIKIFNEHVVLRSETKDANVRSVLDGKVIFAKDTQLLKNVIILEHSNGIHTIYAHLSKIAPTIKVGSKIKKGYIVGKVYSDLTFEVTQQNYHINPMELITQ